MSNYQNIEPYSNAVHIMAQYGGPAMFKESLLQKGYQVGFEMGKRAEKATELWKIPLAVASGIIICKTCGLVRNKWNAYQKKQVGQQTRTCDERLEVAEQSQREDNLEQRQMQNKLVMPMDR